MIGYIYKITSPSGKIYIGQTVDIRKRLNRYSNILCKTQVLLENSLRKYGWRAHIVEILFEGETSNKHLNLLETEYIKIHKSNYKRYPEHNGLNLTDGGDGRRGYKASEETKAKMSAAQKGKKTSDETRAKLSAANIGKKLTPESIAKRSAKRIGKKRDPEVFVKMWETRKKNLEQKRLLE